MSMALTDPTPQAREADGLCFVAKQVRNAVSRSALLKARAVLRYSEALADAVIAGDKALDAAL
jgi:hypothetical protein